MGLDVTYKGQQIAQLTQDGSLTLNTAGTYCEDNIGLKYSGGGSAEISENDVTFFDYDGSVFAAYSASDFLALTELPANPSHPGLTAQGWNWSLTDAKTYVTNHGILNIGQQYITDDAKTRIYLHLLEGCERIELGLFVDGTVVVDWGDGGQTENITGSDDTVLVSTPHTYSALGDYMISIAPTQGSRFCFGYDTISSALFCVAIWKGSGSEADNTKWRGCIRNLEIGSSCALRFRAFYFCRNLCTVTLPIGTNVLSASAIFSNCGCLEYITIPNGTTTLKNGTLDSMKSLKTASLPNGITSVEIYNFAFARQLSSITLPDTVTNSYLSFRDCNIVDKISLSNGMSLNPTMFWFCERLQKIKLPPRLTTIPDNAFYGSSMILDLEIPSTVRTIGANAFANCASLNYIRFLPESPPAVSNSNAFAGINPGIIIYVPHGKKNAYTSATNYPDPNSFTYMEDLE